MTVYLAALPGRQNEMLRISRRLERAGHKVTSRWIHGRCVGATGADNAMYDLADVVVADCFVLFTQSARSRIPAAGTGRHVGLGYALHARKRIVVVGPRENIFCRLDAVERAPNIKSLLALLGDGKETAS
jgi:hypothetical protein